MQFPCLESLVPICRVFSFLGFFPTFSVIFPIVPLLAVPVLWGCQRSSATKTPAISKQKYSCQELATHGPWPTYGQRLPSWIVVHALGIRMMAQNFSDKILYTELLNS